MKRRSVPLLPAVVLWSGSLCFTAAPAARAAETDGSSLAVPPGFVVEPVAGPLLVRRPVVACFDDRGRLYVAESAGTDRPGDEPAGRAPGRIVVLEDIDGDGRFDRSGVFADGIVSPRGLLWHDGAVFVASPAGLWRLRDADGDGVADERKELITGSAPAGATGVVRGACLGPDGYVYTCAGGGAGASAHDLKDVNGKPLHKGRSPLLVRCRPDGTNAEVVGGLPGNPAEVAWSARGEAFASAASFGGGESGGGGDGTRGAPAHGALVHFVEGGDYPVPGSTPDQHEMKNTGGSLPPLVQMPDAAPAGIMCYRGFTLGRPFTGNLICAESGAHAVRRHVLAPDGSTFRARTEDLVTSSSPDFHPTDVLEDADGSLLVVDTGDVLRVDSPVGANANPGALGGIYRVRREGAPRIADARGLRQKWDKVDTEELTRRLEDLRGPVVDRASRELARRGVEGVAALSSVMGKSTSTKTRLNAVWALTRIDGPEARAAVRYALVDHDPAVRQAAVYSAGLHRDAGAQALLIDLLRIDPPATRREAANALGRIGWVKPVDAALLVQAPPPQPGQPQPPGAAPQAVATPRPQAVPEGASAPAAAAPAPGVEPAAATAVAAPAADAKSAAVATAAPATGPTAGPATAPSTAPATAPAAQPPAGAQAPQVAAVPPAPALPPSPAVPALLDALRDGPDRFLEHAAVYALIRIADRESTRKGLQDPDPAVRRGARLALEQMGGTTTAESGGGSGPQGVTPQPGAPGVAAGGGQSLK